MKNILTICCFICIAQMVFSQKSTSEITVKELVKKAVQNEEVIGISVGIISTDGKTWSHSQGLSDRDLNVPFTTSTISRIASITKPITAIAIMQLVEQDKLDLDTKVSHYLEIFNRKDLKKYFIRIWSIGLAY